MCYDIIQWLKQCGNMKNTLVKTVVIKIDTAMEKNREAGIHKA